MKAGRCRGGLGAISVPRCGGTGGRMATADLGSDAISHTGKRSCAGFLAGGTASKASTAGKSDYRGGLNGTTFGQRGTVGLPCRLGRVSVALQVAMPGGILDLLGLR